MRPAFANLPAMLEKLTTAPPPRAFIIGASIRVRIAPLATFTFSARHHSSRVEARPLSWKVTALLIRKSTPPKRFCVAPVSAASSASSVMSVRTKSPRSPSGSVTAVPRSSSTSATTTAAPAAWNARTIVAPRSDAPPMTSATLSVKSNWVLAICPLLPEPVIVHAGPGEADLIGAAPGAMFPRSRPKSPPARSKARAAGAHSQPQGAGRARPGPPTLLHRPGHLRARAREHLREVLDLRRPRVAGAQARRFLDVPDRPPADVDDPGARRQDPCPLQPLPAPRHADLRRALRQRRRRPHLLVPRLALPLRRHHRVAPARARLRGHDLLDLRLQHAARPARRVVPRLRVREPRREGAVAPRVARAGEGGVRRHLRPLARGRGRGRDELLPRDPAVELEVLHGEPARRGAPVGHARVHRARGRRCRVPDPAPHRREAAALPHAVGVRDPVREVGLARDVRLSLRPHDPRRLHGPAAPGPRHGRVRADPREGVRRAEEGRVPLAQHPPHARLSVPVGPVAAAAAPRDPAARARPYALRDLAFPAQGRARGDLPALALVLQPRQLARDARERRRPRELAEEPVGPRLPGRRLGELPPRLRPRPSGGRRDPRHQRLQRDADAYAVPRLARVHDRGHMRMARRAKSPGKTAPKRATRPARKPNGEALQREVEQLLYAQAEALDDKRWQAFIDLFTADGMYWMPPAL